MWKPMLRGLLDLLAPPTCPACDLPTERAHAFCDGCAPLLERTEGGAASLAGFAYGGPLADALRRYKYRPQPELAHALAPLLVTALRPFAGRFDAITFVPLHARRLSARGFDQTGLLAYAAARALGMPAQQLLRRGRSTEVQASLGRLARRTNVERAFALRVPAPQGRYLLLDDVRTTGATLADASRALTEAKIEVVPYALALAEPGEDEPS